MGQNAREQNRQTKVGFTLTFLPVNSVDVEIRNALLCMCLREFL